jgi:hypothetical protein
MTKEEREQLLLLAGKMADFLMCLLDQDLPLVQGHYFI